MQNCIFVFGGVGIKIFETSDYNRVIGMYNLYTEKWGTHKIPCENVAPPETILPCAIAIADDIYMFGGFQSGIHNLETNALWKLGRISKRLEWSEITGQHHAKMPSPRYGHSGWEYADKLWIFGGSGPSLEGYLNDHGDACNTHNNQLLCFDPSTEEWSNPQSTGAVPGPRIGQTMAVTGDQVWLYGGTTSNLLKGDVLSLKFALGGCEMPDHWVKDLSINDILDELYQLNMQSLTWTKSMVTLCTL